jgi:hypothetical protein
MQQKARQHSNRAKQASLQILDAILLLDYLFARFLLYRLITISNYSSIDLSINNDSWSKKAKRITVKIIAAAVAAIATKKEEK